MHVQPQTDLAYFPMNRADCGHVLSTGCRRDYDVITSSQTKNAIYSTSVTATSCLSNKFMLSSCFVAFCTAITTHASAAVILSFSLYVQ